MWNRPVVLALTGATAWLSAGTALADPDCRCRYDGQYFKAGQEICMVVGGEAKRARCGMILNNTAWKFTGGGCPVARVTDDAPMSHIAGTFTPTFSLTGARQ